MNNLVIENFKSIMVYIRNYPDDSDLSQIFVALKDAIQNSDNDIIVQRIKRNMPNPEYWESPKSMRNYWGNYVKPVKKKWRIERLDYIKGIMK